jgi:uncharacterized repeat protein (TIGR03803 family)
MRKTIYAFLLTASYCSLLILRTEAAGCKERDIETISTYLTYPANNSISVNINHTCTARSIANATNYTFQFSIPKDFSTNVLTYNSSSNSVAVSGLKFATKYYARVKSNLNSSYGLVTTFTTKASEQYAFVSKPINGSSGNDAVELKVTANLVLGAKRYTIELNTLADFSDSTLVAVSSIDNQRTLVFTNLKYATKYYARVKTDLSDAYGKVTSFTTRAEQFSVVSEPSANATNADYNVIKIEVAPVHQAKRYVVEVSANASFASVLTNKSLTDHQRVFAFKNLKPNTTYYARSKSNASTDYGQVTQFTTRATSSKRRMWGVTTSGGTNGVGTVFSFSLDSLTFTKHHDNTSTEYLHGSLTPAPGGNFFGMGIQYSTGDAGEIYKIDANGNYTVVYNNGGIHFGSLMLASDNNLYVIDDWLNAFRGGIRKVDTEGNSQDVLASIFHRFRSDNDGKNPIAAPLEVGEHLYGMAPGGGLYKRGVIYKKTFNGAGFEVIYHFNGINGGNPQGSLTLGADGYLYGLTFSGGINNQGTVFKIKPDGSGFKKLLDFNGSNGRYPFGDLVLAGNFFYGMTSEGGSTDNGIVFKISADGAFTKLLDFNGSNGAIPLGNVTVDAGVLYGMTANGGSNDLGVIFRINSNGTGYTKLYDFSTGGGNPDGSIVVVDDTFGSNSNARMIATTTQFTDENEAHAYPNPFVNTITVEMPSANGEKFNVTLTDLSGRVVHQEEANHSLQFGQNLEEGTYIMKVTQGKRVIQQRVVKRL